jgi:hypothetical protein
MSEEFKYKGEIYSHIHRAIDELLPQNALPESALRLSWITDKGIRLDINLERAFALANLSDREMKLVARILTTSIIVGDRVSLLASVMYLVGSLSVNAKARKDIIEVVGQAQKKVTENVAMERIKRLHVGGIFKKHDEEEPEPEELKEIED